jgi:hypothetical protein
MAGRHPALLRASAAAGVGRTVWGKLGFGGFGHGCVL